MASPDVLALPAILRDQVFENRFQGGDVEMSLCDVDPLGQRRTREAKGPSPAPETLIGYFEKRMLLLVRPSWAAAKTLSQNLADDVTVDVG